MRELSLNEIEAASGGVVPLVPALLVAGSFVAGVAAGYGMVALAEAIF